MINLTELLDRAKKKALEKPDAKDGYAPKSTDELRFKKKHVVQKTDDRNGNKDDVFKATNIKTLERAKERHGYNPDEDEQVYEEAEKPDRLAAIAAAAKKKNAQIGKTIVTGSKGGVGGAETRRYPAGTLKNSHEPEGEQIDERNKLNKMLKNLHARKVGATRMQNHGSPELNRIAALKKGRELMKNSHEPEGDQLDELSKETLKSYTQKAAFPANPSTIHTPKGAKRVKGLIKATNKLYLKQYEEVEPEGEELDEAKRKKSPTEKLFNRLKNYGVKDPSVKPLVGNQHKIDANKNGRIDADDFKKLRKEEVQVDEVLKPSMGAAAYVSDFVHSKNPKFAGKSKKERMKQALAAYYTAKRGE
jgi:hypothetical protein